MVTFFCCSSDGDYADATAAAFDGKRNAFASFQLALVGLCGNSLDGRQQHHQAGERDESFILGRRCVPSGTRGNSGKT